MATYRMARLFDQLGVPGPDLLLRDYGRRAFPALEQELEAVEPGHALILDFEGVSVMDTSFADETVLELAIDLATKRHGDRFLVLDRPSQATLDNLEGTIARRKAKVGLLVRGNDEVAIVGHLEPNLMAAWQLARDSGRITARQLADRLGLEINTASMRLRKLYDARTLARQEEISSEGRQHIYMLPP